MPGPFTRGGSSTANAAPEPSPRAKSGGHDVNDLAPTLSGFQRQSRLGLMLPRQRGKMAEREGFEPFCRLEAKSRGIADLFDGLYFENGNKKQRDAAT